MAALGQTITVVNKSGKIVSSGKHIASLWNEARAAYRERKAELKYAREDPEGANLATKDRYLDDDARIERKNVRPVQSRRRSSSRHSTHSHRSSKSHQPRRRHEDEYDDNERRRHRRSSYSESTHGQSSRSSRDHHASASAKRYRPHLDRGMSHDSGRSSSSHQQHRRRPRANDQPRTQPPTPPSPLRQEAQRDIQSSELARRHSDSEFNVLPVRTVPRRSPTSPADSMALKSATPPEVDMDLAYGELPPLPARPGTDEAEIRTKVTALNALLEEMNCLHHSATTIVKSLEKNPQAMAAVALTLAEISNIARKLAPGALSGLRATAPAVLALLASPEFLIAAGVGVGVTVVMFGGYKIIKMIRAGKDKAKEAPLLAGEAAGSSYKPPAVEDEAATLEELQTVDRINEWRRGLENADVESVATSVEGEFITPGARRALVEQGVMDGSEVVDSGKKGKEKTKAKGRDKKEKSTKGKEKKKDGADEAESDSSGTATATAEKKVKEKATGGLRMLFKK